MLRGLIIIVVVIAVLVGGLLALRSTRNMGMPGEDVLERAARRERKQSAEDEADR
jgi:hypothetical protein